MEYSIYQGQELQSLAAQMRPKARGNERGEPAATLEYDI